MLNKLKEIAEYLNEHFSQESDEYSIIHGAKRQVIRYDDETAISIWGCGAIVCIRQLLYFISEDDGYWWVKESKDDRCPGITRYGYVESFNIGWVEDFTKAMNDLLEYVNKNGESVYYSGTDIICNYKLVRKDE